MGTIKIYGRKGEKGGEGGRGNEKKEEWGVGLAEEQKAALMIT